MTKRLNEEDRQAVDVLLDRAVGGRSNGNGDGNGSSDGHVSTESHVQAAEKVLSLLDSLPAPEPSRDLLARTMHRIDTTPRVPITQPAPTYARSQPHA